MKRQHSLSLELKNNDRELIELLMPGTPKPFSDSNLEAQKMNFESLNKNKDTQVMTIEGEGLRKIAKNLISDGVDLSKHHSDMENSSDKYDADKDLYTVYYARDYWGEDKYCLDTEKELVISETDDAVTVTAEVQYVPNLGSVENVRTLQYTFDKVASDGVLFYRINSIKEVK